MSDNALLPLNASPAEIALAGTVARISDVPVPLRSLYSPEECPAPLLPWLAWALSVDEWDSAASEAEKRAVIKNSLYVHKHKGTLAALKRAVEPLGYQINIIEWFNDTPVGIPYTFRLEVFVEDQGITDATYDRLELLVETYKNVRSHMLQLSLKAQAAGTIYLGAACVSGSTTEVYPYAATDLSSNAMMRFAAGLQSFDYVSIYPN